MGDLMVCLRSLTKQNEKLQKVIDEIRKETTLDVFNEIEYCINKKKLESMLPKLGEKE